MKWCLTSVGSSGSAKRSSTGPAHTEPHTEKTTTGGAGRNKKKALGMSFPVTATVHDYQEIAKNTDDNRSNFKIMSSICKLAPKPLAPVMVVVGTERPLHGRKGAEPWKLKSRTFPGKCG